MSSLVSICVPTYNGECFLAEALESIEAQTYRNCEVEVSDDASSDQTLEIVAEFVARSTYECRILSDEPSCIAGGLGNLARGRFLNFSLRN